ncbi:hypothetical protein [Sulfurimonas sp.]
MDGLAYYGVLFIIGVIAFMFYQNNSERMALIMLILGAYIIYSHTTGHTMTEWKNEAIESLDEKAQKYSKEHGTDGFDEDSYKNVVR